MDKFLRRKTRLAVGAAVGLFIVGSLCAGCSDDSGPPPRSHSFATGAMHAQVTCYGLINHDTWEFGDCVRTLADHGKRSTKRQLGIEYFGWVGAMNSARLGMQGADETAQEFLVRFRSMQRKLDVDDETLCAAVPGDCVARTARLLQMERESTGSSQSKRR